MSLAEPDKRNGWKHQATGVLGSLAESDRALPAPATQTAAVSAALLNDRRKGLLLVSNKRPDTLSHAIETSLARELGLVSHEGPQQKPQDVDGPSAPPAVSNVVTTPQSAKPAAAHVQVATSANAIEERAERLASENALLCQKLAALEKASAEMQAANAKALAEQADRFARDNALLSQQAAEADGALNDAHARIKSLEAKSTATEEDGALRAGLAAKLEAMTAENAGLSRAAAEQERAVATAHTRVEYLEAALAAAEAECGRLRGEAAEHHRAQTEMAALKVRFEVMSSRATMAEQLLAETRERLVGHIIEMHDAQQAAARANVISTEASGRQRQLEEALSSQQSRLDVLEQSQAALAEASADLLQRFHERDRALAAAEATIKALAERNARFEIAARQPAGASAVKADRSRAEVPADQDWAELARLLGSFVERKSAPHHALPRT
jgi:hypothetical protein